MAVLLGLLSGPAPAQSPGQTYRDKCGSCHDSGAGQAPRVDDARAWTERLARGRRALHAAAIAGVPNSAMAAKGGFPELGDDQVRAVVDHMLGLLGRAGLPDGPLPAATIARASPAESAAAVTGPLAARVAERVRAALGDARARVEEYAGVYTVRGVGIKVEAGEGGVVLSGAVHDAALIERAAAIAVATPGVNRVVNRVIAAGQLEWD
jgi:cytochrome c5